MTKILMAVIIALQAIRFVGMATSQTPFDWDAISITALAIAVIFGESKNE